ncbi:MotA/TolQ/ExbB proton channel family protein [Lutimaribacter marinistellae]|uniref:MotA/TolQ/ExbB proton channel family protein n=1 Tax=Lutimaribacter marinistellae TaxID=1820329 RepID=A0ABV7TFS9_9RHOB
MTSCRHIFIGAALAFCVGAGASAQEVPATPPTPEIGQAPTTGMASKTDQSERVERSAPAPQTAETIADSAAEVATEPSVPQVSTTVPAEQSAPVALPGTTTEGDEATTPQMQSAGSVTDTARNASDRAMAFLREGGPAIWAIAALSVITVALILWKIWRLALIGAWSRGKAGRAVEAYLAGEPEAALALVEGRRGIRSQVMAVSLRSLGHLPHETAREETARVAKRHLSSARDGLGALELIATIAPLLGLLGTVLGMIAAFQALQAAGSRADPALLAGGIWEALLTTAAGMAVAIPASAALTWFDSVIERMRRDIEDNATRVFIAATPARLKLAAE